MSKDANDLKQSFNEKITILTEELKSKDLDREILVKEFEIKKGEMNFKIKEQNNNIEKIMSNNLIQNEELNKKIETISKDANDLKESLNEKIIYITEELKSKELNLNNLKKEFVDEKNLLNNKIGDLENENSINQNKINENILEKESQNNKIEDLSKEFKIIQNQNILHEINIKGLNERIEELMVEGNSKDIERETKLNEIEVLMKKNIELISELNQYKRDKEEIFSQMINEKRKLTEKIESLKNKFQIKNEKLESLSFDLEKLTKCFNDQTISLDQKKSEIEKTLVENNVLQNKLITLENHNNELILKYKDSLNNYQISQNLLEKVNKDYDLLKLKATDSETISLKTNEQLKENVIPFFIVDRQVNENSKFIL